MWDVRYADAEYAYGKEPNDFLAEMAPRLTAGRTLCLAEGEGRNGVYLAGLGHDVHAVDASTVGLEKALRLAEERGVAISTTAADLAAFDIEEGAWDTVVSIFCHVPPSVRAPLHRRVVAGLRPGGMLLLEAYTPAQLAMNTGGPPVAELLMTLDTLRRELEGLDFLHARETERNVVEGRYHTGRAAVVQVLAVKPSTP